MLKSAREAKERPEFQKAPVEAERHRVRGGADHIPVSSIMSKEVVTARPDLSVEAAVALMFDKGITRLPVVDPDGTLLGIVSYTDIATGKVLEGHTGEVANARLPRGVHVETEGATVADRMTKQVITIREGEPILRAAELMAKNHVHGLPVVRGNRLIGIVSTMDVVGWVAGLE